MVTAILASQLRFATQAALGGLGQPEKPSVPWWRQ